MAGPSWLVDPNRIATKIRSASGALDPGKVNWKSNPTKSCPNCHYVIDNSDVIQVWPGLPRGVKFDPSDHEIIWHLLAKSGAESFKSHPFIDEFIPTVEEEDGICYTHPQNLPGVKQDGSISHFFHRAVKAYSTGTRKRRKIHGDDFGDVRWHKTGRTKSVHLDGVQKGCKKIMVLYVSSVKGGKAEKTNWVMHQYHLGTGEDEQEGEYVISKIFYQQQQGKLTERTEADNNPDITERMITKVDPITPKSVTPEPPRAERSFLDRGSAQDLAVLPLQEEDEGLMVAEMENAFESHNPTMNISENHGEHKSSDEPGEENKWWENESQFLLSSQQLVEGLSLCDELLQSQSPGRDDFGNVQNKNSKVLLSHYALLGPEDLKRDLEECQKLAMGPANVELDTPPEFLFSQQKLEIDHPANIELDTPPDFRLSQLEFESQESYIAWGGSIHGGSKAVD